MKFARTIKFSIIKFIRFWKPKADYLLDSINCFLKFAIFDAVKKAAKSKRKNKNSSQEYYRNPTTAEVFRIQGVSHSNSADGNENRPQKKRCCTAKCVKTYLEIIGIVGGLIGIIVLCWQTYEVKKSVNIASDQLVETQINRIQDERAWIGVTQTVLENSQDNPSNDDFRVEFKNTGRTPATDLAVWIDGETYVPRFWLITNTSTNWFRYSGMLAPDATGSINTSAHFIEDNEINAIKKGMPYYVYGKIWYRDIFKVVHWTEFCYQIVWNPNLSALPVTAHNACDDVQTNGSNQ